MHCMFEDRLDRTKRRKRGRDTMGSKRSEWVSVFQSGNNDKSAAVGGRPDMPSGSRGLHDT